MILKSPVIITSRLLPGVKIGDATISIKYANRPGDNGRTRYIWHIDAEDNYEGDNLQCSPDGTLQQGLEALLGFLGAFAEAIVIKRSYGIKCAYPDFFPAQLANWAVDNVDKISELQDILQEKELISE